MTNEIRDMLSRFGNPVVVGRGLGVAMGIVVGAVIGALTGDSHCNVEETVHVGDHLLNDIVGAQELGMRTVWVEGFDASETEVRPTATIQRIADLPDALVRLAAS